MRFSLLFVLAFGLVACSHPSAPAPQGPKMVASTWKGPAILAPIPADTPYLLAVLEPMPPALREHWYADNAKRVKDMLKKAASGEGRLALVAAAFYAELDGVTDEAHWPEALGLSMDARMVFYGLSIWPVIRLEVKDPARVREVLARVVKAGDPDLQPQTTGNGVVYTLKDGRFSFVFGTVDKELVGALVPTESVDKAMPAILGTQAPAHSLRDAKLIPSLLAKHNYMPTMIAFGDVARVLEAVSGTGKGENDRLAAMLAGKIPASCNDDLSRIAGEFPRVVAGYHRLDADGFEMVATVEAPASLLKSLEKLHTPMPTMSMKAGPMLAVGAAVNLDAMIAWLRDAAGQLRAHPFRCDALAGANHEIDNLAAKLDQPLPPMMQGLRGFELIVDDATMMPPSGTGHLLVAGDHVADLIHQLLAKIPQLAGLALQPNGVAVELPLDKLGVPASLKSAHVAMKPTRAALAVGDSSAARASARVAAPDGHAPLFVFTYDLPKLRQRFGMFMKDDDVQDVNLGTASMALDVADDGISVEVVGTWSHGR